MAASMAKPKITQIAGVITTTARTTLAGRLSQSAPARIARSEAVGRRWSRMVDP
jgi:hypothetical protein